MALKSRPRRVYLARFSLQACAFAGRQAFLVRRNMDILELSILALWTDAWLAF
jgi:hypothetical protein